MEWTLAFLVSILNPSESEMKDKMWCSEFLLPDAWSDSRQLKLLNSWKITGEARKRRCDVDSLVNHFKLSAIIFHITVNHPVCGCDDPRPFSSDKTFAIESGGSERGGTSFLAQALFHLFHLFWPRPIRKVWCTFSGGGEYSPPGDADAVGEWPLRWPGRGDAPPPPPRTRRDD